MIIEGRVVRLGNSRAISVSKKDLDENKLKLNQRIKFAVLKPNKKKALMGLVGLMKGAGDFVREEEDREF